MGVVVGCDLRQEAPPSNLKSEMSQMSPDKIINSRGSEQKDGFTEFTVMPLLSRPDKKVTVMFVVKGLFVDLAESFVFPFTGKGFLCIHDQIALNNMR